MCKEGQRCFSLEMLVLLCLWVVGFNGCSVTRSTGNVSWRHGYALLHDVLSRNSNADKILWVKLESDMVDTLVNTIVDECAYGVEKIQGFAEKDAAIDLDVRTLPMIEDEARAEIESETAGELLSASGTEFEVGFLITQLRALRYASALSRALAEHEEDADRLEFLERFSERCTALEDKVFTAILTTSNRGD